jgi:hypothetical protein
MKAALIVIGLIGSGAAASIPDQGHASFHKRDVCSGNTATNRQTWCDYDLSTNYYDLVPDTGMTR